MNPTIKARIEKIKNGEVPEGYKRTKIGIVPNEWKERKLKNYFTRLTRKNAENNQNVLTISAQYGLISQEDFFNKSVASENKSNYFLLLKGDLAYNKSYSNGYPYGAIKRLEYYDKGIVSPLYICMEPQNSFVADYFVQYFEGGLLNGEIHAFAQEGARNHGLLNIAVDDFFNTNVVVPCEVEQQRIAEILATQDKVIELQEKLLKEKQRQKKYLMQQLLTKKKRLPGFSGEWKKIALVKCLKGKTQKELPSDKAPLMAFVAEKGIVPKGERYDRSFLVKNSNKLYKRTDYNDFIYSSNNLDVGSIGLNLFGSAVISDVYEVFSVLNGYVPMIVSEIIKLPKNIYQIIRFRQGVIYGQYRIYAEDFLSVIIRMPSFAEQTAIAQILSTADKEIELLKKDIEQEKLKKKSLMQLLLTGIVRVNEVAL